MFVAAKHFYVPYFIWTSCSPIKSFLPHLKGRTQLKSLGRLNDCLSIWNSHFRFQVHQHSAENFTAASLNQSACKTGHLGEWGWVIPPPEGYQSRLTTQGLLIAGAFSLGQKSITLILGSWLAGKGPAAPRAIQGSGVTLEIPLLPS